MPTNNKIWTFIFQTAPLADGGDERLDDHARISGPGGNRWRDGGRFHLLDGFMMTANLEPLTAAGDPNPVRDGYGNFGYLRYDPAAGKLTLYADACESRNIFYRHDGDRLVVSNAIGALVQALGAVEVDDQSLFGFLRFGYLNVNEKTMFKDIRKLKAGERLDAARTDKGITVAVSRYWTPEIGDRKLSVGAAIEEVEANLAAYFKGALTLFDAPMTTLTCGIDSNLFFYILEKHAGRLKSVTHAFDNPDYDEFRLLKQARATGPDNYKLVSHDDIMGHLSDAIAAIGHPINGLASMGEYKVYRFARNQRADGLITGAGDYIWVPVNRNKMDEIMASQNLAYAGDGTLLAPTDYLADSFLGDMEGWETVFHDVGIETVTPLKKHLLDQVFVKRTPHIAFDHAALGVAFGIECIEPFVERRTVEFCLGLSDGSLFFDNLPKSLLVNLLNRFHGKPFPKSLKMNTPQRELIKGPYRESIQALIADSRLADAGYLDRAKLAKAYRSYANQEELGNSYFVWKFIVAEIWYRHFIKNETVDLYQVNA